MHLLRPPDLAGSQHLVPQTVAFGERQERPEIGLRDIRRAWSVAEGAKRGKPFGATGEQEAILEQLPFAQLHQSEGRERIAASRRLARRPATSSLPEVSRTSSSIRGSESCNRSREPASR